MNVYLVDFDWRYRPLQLKAFRDTKRLEQLQAGTPQAMPGPPSR